MPENRPGLSRRTLAKGAAWAAPAVALASAAPALATSGPTPSISFGTACKAPGASCNGFPKGYIVLNTKICNTSSLPVYVYSVTYTTTPVGVLPLTYTPPPALPFLVPANDCVTFNMSASAQNSANHSFTLNVTALWGHTPTYGTDPQQGEHDATPIYGSVAIPKTPPDCCKTTTTSTTTTTTTIPVGGRQVSTQQKTSATEASPTTQKPVTTAAPSTTAKPVTTAQPATTVAPPATPVAPAVDPTPAP